MYLLQWKTEGNQRNQRKRKEVQIDMFVMLVSFYVVWIPYVIVALLMLAGCQVPTHTQLASALLTKFGVIINPYVFVFRNKDVSE